MKILSIFGATLIMAMSLFFTVVTDAGVQAATDSVYKSLTCQELYQLMQQFNLEVKLASDVKDDIEKFSNNETILWLLNDDMALININDQGRRVEFCHYEESKNKDLLQRVNKWNADNLYARSFVDQDGDAVIMFELDTTGGVTEASIEKFFNTCARQYREWKAAVVDAE